MFDSGQAALIFVGSMIRVAACLSVSDETRLGSLSRPRMNGDLSMGLEWVDWYFEQRV